MWISTNAFRGLRISMISGYISIGIFEIRVRKETYELGASFFAVSTSYLFLLATCELPPHHHHHPPPPSLFTTHTFRNVANAQDCHGSTI